MIHVENVPLIINATGPNMFNAVRKNPFLKKYTDAEIGAMIALIIERLESGIATTREMKNDISEIDKEFRWILLLAMAQGKVVRATASHARSSLTAYALLEKWAKGISIPEMTQEQAVTALVEKYINAFGPVTVDDIAWWIPLTKTDTRRVVETLTEKASKVEINGTHAYMAPEDYEKAKSLEYPPEPVVWFLPYEDHLPKAFTERAWYVSDEMRARLFPKLREHYWPPDAPPPPKKFSVTGATNVSGEIRPSIWINGETIGRWEMEEKGEKIGVVQSVFSKVHPKYGNIATQQGSDLQAFINKRLVPISTSKWPG